MNNKQKELLEKIKAKKTANSSVIMNGKKRDKGASGKSNSEAKVSNTVKKRDKG